MSTKVWLSTRAAVLDPEDATISVFDRGFLFGDSVYETLRTAGRQAGASRVIGLPAHLDRLRRSAEGIALDVPFADEEIAAALDQTIAEADNEDSRIRIVVTRGTGPIDLDTRRAGSPVLVIIVTPLTKLPREIYLRGISAVVVSREASLLPGLKTGNYLGNILALREAHQQGADDAILCNTEGAVAEGATSNLFAVIDGSVHTPSLSTGLLAGITRGLVIRLLDEQLALATCERTILAVELRGVDELFLTSSVRGVMPVTRLDDRVIGDGTAGPITRRVLEAYEASLGGVALGSGSD